MAVGSGELVAPIYVYDSSRIQSLPLLGGKSSGSYDPRKTASAGVRTIKQVYVSNKKVCLVEQIFTACHEDIATPGFESGR